MSQRQPRLSRIDAPPCDGGAPMPVVLQDDGMLVFAYRVAGARQSDGHSVAVAVVDPCTIATFGYPNDEALHEHRYAGIGLECYNAYEVVDSEWIESIMIANRAHSHHSDDLFRSQRHFIFAFHDSTLEFIALEMPKFELVSGEVFGMVETAYKAWSR